LVAHVSISFSLSFEQLSTDSTMGIQLPYISSNGLVNSSGNAVRADRGTSTRPTSAVDNSMMAKAERMFLCGFTCINRRSFRCSAGRQWMTVSQYSRSYT
jgi:hypothetical protein